jgi:hypothetical protein
LNNRTDQVSELTKPGVQLPVFFYHQASRRFQGTA